jgi:hypothetical protein
VTDPAWIGSSAALIGVAVGSVLTWLTQRNEWIRQKRWELKRDVVLEALRAYGDLENALTDLSTAQARPTGVLTDEAEAGQKRMKFEAMQQFRKCSTVYRNAQAVADLAVGGDFSKNLSMYFQYSAPLARKALVERQNVLGESEIRKGIALRGNEVIISARGALNIKDAGELPRLDDIN